jgi:predicted nucleic acid-binding protein
MLVIDSSIAVKWMVREPDSERALSLLDRPDRLLAPELIWAEVSNVVWKLWRRGALTADRARGVLADLDRLPLEVVGMLALKGPALEIALDLDHPTYDSLYLALARERGARLATADRRLHDKVERSPFAGLTLWLGDLP